MPASGPSTLTTSVPTVLALRNIPTAASSMGEPAIVQATKKLYYLDPTSLGPDDGVTFIAAQDGGMWVVATTFLGIAATSSHIIEGWFVGGGNGAEPSVGGVGANTPPTPMPRFAVPATNAAPLNQWPDNAYNSTKAGTITELGAFAFTVNPVNPAVGFVTVQIQVNGVNKGVPLVLTHASPNRAIAQNIAYNAFDSITINWSTSAGLTSDNFPLEARLVITE